MKRREDWKILKKLPVSMANVLKSLPLICFDKDTSIWEGFMKNRKLLISSDNPRQMFNDFINFEREFGNDFLFLDNSNINEDFIIHNRVQILPDNRTINLQLLSESDGHLAQMTFQIREGTENGLHIETMSLKGIRSNSIFDSTVPFSTENYTDLNKYAARCLGSMWGFFKTLDESDLYPVSRQGVQTKKLKKSIALKKPWLREDLVSIVFLNQLPTTTINSASKGGHHASPRFHHRKGHDHTMRAERFKNHPDYMKPIYRKAVWVGERTGTTPNGTTYKVL